MWKSKYKCFIIKSRYICTKDSDLATVYTLVKQAVRPSVTPDDFDILLKETICALERFASHRRLTNESRYIDVIMSIKWAYDTYDISEEDFQRTQVMLYDCLYGLQELEEYADRNAPLAESDTNGYDSLQLTFAYREIPDYIGIWNMIASLGRDEKERKTERSILAARKNEILHFIESAIEHGNTGLYVAKALLNIYNDWSTCIISDLHTFQKKLFEGIEHGCLAPDNHYGWEWLEVAAKYNNPACFMEDMDLYYEVLDSAASHGVVEAIDIMNSIWEPEQIIEED